MEKYRWLRTANGDVCPATGAPLEETEHGLLPCDDRFGSECRLQGSPSYHSSKGYTIKCKWFGPCCESCVDGELSMQHYTPGDYYWADGEKPPENPPEACETCDWPYKNHRLMPGHTKEGNVK